MSIRIGLYPQYNDEDMSKEVYSVYSIPFLDRDDLIF